MQRKEALVENEVDRTLGQMLENPKMKERVTSLAPYIAEIQRRKKLRGLAKQSKKNLNQSSSRSFRIKQQSLSSLHKETFLKTRQTTVNTIVSRLNQQRPRRGHRGQSLQRHRQLQTSKTIDSRPKHVPSAEASTFFNQLYVRVKSKVEKERPVRKKQYETIQVNRTRSEHQDDLRIGKIGYTNPGHVLVCNQEDRKKSQKAKKNNFRRTKFELDVQPPFKIERVEAYSETQSELGKKESNVSLNREMDRLAEKQMDCFYKQIRNKQIHRSVQHYTEQYFSNQSYRPVKSKNEIEVFVSIAKNPLVQKFTDTIQSQTQLDQKSTSNLFYDFDFPSEEVKWKKITIDNCSKGIRE